MTLLRVEIAAFHPSCLRFVLALRRKTRTAGRLVSVALILSAYGGCPEIIRIRRLAGARTFLPRRYVGSSHLSLSALLILLASTGVAKVLACLSSVAIAASLSAPLLYLRLI